MKLIFANALVIFCLAIGPLALLAQKQPQQRGAGNRVKAADGSLDKMELYDGSYALVIGESTYTDGWENLPGVREDVPAIKRVLEDGGFQVEAFVNLGSEAIKARISSFISEHGYSKNNRLLIYFAGHGHTQLALDGRDLGYIVPSDTPLPEKNELGFRRKAISMETIQGYARQIEAKHAMFVFDSCFSGKLVSREKLYIPPAILDDVEFPVRQFITAGASNQRVPDESIFRKVFVRALEGEADRNGDKFVTGTELAEFVKEKVTNVTARAQTPQYGKIRDVDLDRGDFVFMISKKRLSAAISEIEQRAETLANQALSEFLRGNNLDAYRLINESLQLKESAFATGVRGCVRSLIREESQEARADLEKALKSDPNNLIFLAQLVVAFNFMNEKALEKKVANEIVHRLTNPKTALEFDIRGLSYASLDRFDDAIADYSKTIELDPNFIFAYSNRGFLLFAAKQDYDRALKDLNKSVELNPRFALAYLIRGSIFVEKRDFDLAIRDLSKAIELNPRHTDAYFKRGFALYGKQNFDASLWDFSKAIELNPKYWEPYAARGAVYLFGVKNYDASIVDFTRAIGLNPRNAEAFNLRGYSYSYKQDFDSAISDFTSAIQLNPQFEDAYYSRGAAYVLKESYSTGIRDLTRAIELNPQRAESYAYRANAYEKTGRSDLAAADRKKWEELRPKQ